MISFFLNNLRRSEGGYLWENRRAKAEDTYSRRRTIDGERDEEEALDDHTRPRALISPFVLHGLTFATVTASMQVTELHYLDRYSCQKLSPRSADFSYPVTFHDTRSSVTVFIEVL